MSIFHMILTFAIAMIITSINGYNILGVFPHAAQSHFNIFGSLMEQLAKRGHNVTVISYFPRKDVLPNYHDISLVGTGQILINTIPIQTNTKLNFENYFEHLRISQNGLSSCEVVGSTTIQNFLKLNQSYDVIIQEHYNTDCFLVLNFILKAPSIGITTCTIHPWLLDRMGIPVNPAYFPINLFRHSDQMSFLERIQNTIGYFLHGHLLAKLWMTDPSNNLVRKYFGSNFPLLEDIAKNTSLYLVNTHFAINKARPLPPNVIEISGIHLTQPKKLPKDIQEFIDNSTQDVIYFSFGSMMKGSSIPEKDRLMFIDAFKELPYKVLWKFENESLISKPDNVMIRQWMPQFDILSHSKVKAFISHGGLLGFVEAIQSGVPIVAIPFYNEQYINAKALELSDVARIVNGDSFTKDDIINAIKSVLDPKVQEKMKRLSKLYKDRPMSPMDTAIWWVEYVARNGGHMDTLRSSVVGMPVYKWMLLDVATFVLSVIFISLFLVYNFSKKFRTKNRCNIKRI
ncbi:UDP-glycosyltransferase UGT5-like [Chrysoperla carnea]|uniref:UDP-glycosyltransferase UGT5-like n=1 Tax=Chrysoperla carnea TaxID=189513 RepID=UPI001D0701EA|nr:UDP-glycosyltransferase UGT5-like [Chrysoperla carnea]